jgi:hypothetical protein
MPLKEQIATVSEQISEWLSSFDKLSAVARERLRLTRLEQTDEEYRYHYSISLETTKGSGKHA